MNFNINNHILNAADYLNDYEITSSYFTFFYCCKLKLFFIFFKAKLKGNVKILKGGLKNTS